VLRSREELRDEDLYIGACPKQKYILMFYN